jgi:hypothetical protein
MKCIFNRYISINTEQVETIVTNVIDVTDPHILRRVASIFYTCRIIFKYTVWAPG